MNNSEYQADTDTIVAIATASGRAGVGVVRLSGKNLTAFIDGFIGETLNPRVARYGPFYDASKDALDMGIALFFPAPHSFTGENVLELQAHGGPIVLDLLLQRAIELGARRAKPGEFSERAFLNDKMDLTQAEAVADLIDASSEQAARSALRSLQGEFSKQIGELLERLIALRIYVEAAIDFPEEEIDFLQEGKVAADLQALIDQFATIYKQAQQGSLMREGMTVVIAGKANAGKSSLLNALAGRDAAIVTDIAGTTRDVLREKIHIDGMPLHIIDTAGLRESDDPIEQEGIRRAWQEIEQADQVLFVIDSSGDYSLDLQQNWPEYFQRFPDRSNITFILNKIDLSGLDVSNKPNKSVAVLQTSVKLQQGLDELRLHLKQSMGYTGTGEDGFIARRRHVEALDRTLEFLHSGQDQLLGSAAGELLAEDLRLAQQSLSEITGHFTSDDLLGHIFSSFCIGK